MGQKIGILASLCGILALHFACSEEVDHRQQSKARSSDLTSQNAASIQVYLPHRSMIEGLAEDSGQALNAFYLRLSPKGDRCQDNREIEILDPYEDGRLLEFSTLKSCDYQLDLILGENSQFKAAPFQPSVNYRDDIRPLVSQHCLSCHESYDSYDELVSDPEEIVFQVENQLMPPKAPLAPQEIAKFIAWQVNGFTLENPNRASEDRAEAQLDYVYYRSNFNTVIYDYSLQYVNHFVFKDSLWLQKDGENLGLATVEIPLWMAYEQSRDQKGGR